jgi:hypothetical protein
MSFSPSLASQYVFFLSTVNAQTPPNVTVEAVNNFLTCINNTGVSYNYKVGRDGLITLMPSDIRLFNRLQLIIKLTSVSESQYLN